MHSFFGLVTGLGVICEVQLRAGATGVSAGPCGVSDGAAGGMAAGCGCDGDCGGGCGAGFAVWALLNREVAGGSLHKLGLDGPGFVMARVVGLGSLVMGAAIFWPRRWWFWAAFGSRGSGGRLAPRGHAVSGGRRGGGLRRVDAGRVIAGATEVKGSLAVTDYFGRWFPRQYCGCGRHFGPAETVLGTGVGALWIVAMLALLMRRCGTRDIGLARSRGLEAALEGRGPVVSDVMWVLETGLPES